MELRGSLPSQISVTGCGMSSTTSDPGPAQTHADTGWAHHKSSWSVCTRARDRVLLTRCDNGLKYSQKIYFMSLYIRFGRSDSPTPCTGTRTESLALTHTCIAEAMIGASWPPARAANALQSVACAHTAQPSRLLATMACMPLTTSASCEHEA